MCNMESKKKRPKTGDRTKFGTTLSMSGSHLFLAWARLGLGEIYEYKSQFGI